jgi:hypothetical protein
VSIVIYGLTHRLGELHQHNGKELGEKLENGNMFKNIK